MDERVFGDVDVEYRRENVCGDDGKDGEAEVCGSSSGGVVNAGTGSGRQGVKSGRRGW